ncbi:RPS25 [Symbiodinium sp. KB8]|nr:RPS25 [Symbiodinium sp. KB8]
MARAEGPEDLVPSRLAPPPPPPVLADAADGRWLGCYVYTPHYQAVTAAVHMPPSADLQHAIDGLLDCAPGAPAGLFPGMVPIRPQRFPGYLQVIRFPTFLRQVHDGGAAPRFFIGCRSKVWPLEAQVLLRDGDAIVGTFDSSPRSLISRAEDLQNRDTWGTLRHFFAPECRQSTCVMYRDKRYCVGERHYRAYGLYEYIVSFLGVDVGRISACTFPIRDLDVQGDHCQHVVVVADVAPPTGGHREPDRRDLFVLCDLRPLGLKPKYLYTHVPRLHLPSLAADLGIALPAGFDLGVLGARLLGDTVRISGNCTLLFYAKLESSNDSSSSAASLLSVPPPDHQEALTSPDALHSAANASHVDVTIPEGHSWNAGATGWIASAEDSHSVWDDNLEGSARIRRLEDEVSLSRHRTSAATSSESTPGHAAAGTGSTDAAAMDVEHPAPANTVPTPAPAEPLSQPGLGDDVASASDGESFSIVAVVYAPDVSPEMVAIHLHLPCGVDQAVAKVASARLPGASCGFTCLTPVAPQPCLEFMLLVASPTWLTDRPVVLFDCLRTTRALFAKVLFPSATRETYSLQLAYGMTVRKKSLFMDFFNLCSMVPLLPQIWPHDSCMHYWILTEGSPTLFTVGAWRRQHAREDLAWKMFLPPTRATLLPRAIPPALTMNLAAVARISGIEMAVFLHGAALRVPEVPGTSSTPGAEDATSTYAAHADSSLHPEPEVMWGAAQTDEVIGDDMQPPTSVLTARAPVEVDIHWLCCLMQRLLSDSGLARAFASQVLMHLRQAGGDACRTQPVPATSVSDEEEDSLWYLADLAFTLLAPEYQAEVVVMQVVLPQTQVEVLDLLETCRGRDNSVMFPCMSPVHPQPDHCSVHVVMHPAWMQGRVVVCMDLLQYDGRLFAAAAAPLVDSYTLLNMAGLSSASHITVYVPGLSGPVSPGEEVFLSTGDCVTFVPPGADLRGRCTLHEVLTSPVEIMHESPPPPRPVEDRFCLVADGFYFDFLLTPERSFLFRQDMGLRLNLPAGRVMLNPAHPTVENAHIYGRQCRSVVAIGDRLEESMQPRYQVGFLDCRPILEGWRRVRAPNGWLNLGAIRDGLMQGAPPGFRVHIEGSLPHWEWLWVEPGQVFRVLFQGVDADGSIPDTRLPGTNGPAAALLVEPSDLGSGSRASSSRSAPPLTPGTPSYNGQTPTRGTLSCIWSMWGPEFMQAACLPGALGLTPVYWMLQTCLCSLLNVAVCVIQYTCRRLMVILAWGVLLDCIEALGVDAVQLQQVPAPSDLPATDRMPDSHCAGDSFRAHDAVSFCRPIPTPCRGMRRAPVDGLALDFYRVSCDEGASFADADWLNSHATLLEQALWDAECPAFFLSATLLETLHEHFSEPCAAPLAVASVAPRQLLLEAALPSVPPASDAFGYSNGEVPCCPGNVEVFDLTNRQCLLPCSPDLIQSLLLPMPFGHLLGPPPGLPRPERFAQWVSDGAIGRSPAPGEIVVFTADGSFDPLNGAAGWGAVVSLVDGSDPRLPGQLVGCAAASTAALQNLLGEAFPNNNAYLAEVSGLLWAALIALRLPGSGPWVFRADNISALQGVAGTVSMQANELADALANHAMRTGRPDLPGSMLMQFQIQLTVMSLMPSWPPFPGCLGMLTPVSMLPLLSINCTGALQRLFHKHGDLSVAVISLTIHSGCIPWCVGYGIPFALAIVPSAPHFSVVLFTRFGRGLRSSCRADRREHLAQLSVQVAEAPCSALHTAVRKVIRPKKYRRAGAAPLPMLKKDDGDVCISQEEITQVWRDHFRVLEAGQEVDAASLATSCRDRQQATESSDLVDVKAIPTWTQLQSAFRATAPHKACGPDLLPPVLCTLFSQKLTEVFWPVMLKAILRANEPIGLKGGLLHRIAKPSAVENTTAGYRGILVQSCLSKVLHRSARHMAIQHWDQHVLPLQIGGRKGCPASFGHFCSRAFLAMARAKGQSVAILFVDIAAAYYGVIREAILGSQASGRPLHDLVAKLGMSADDMQRLQHYITQEPVLQQQGAHELFTEVAGELHRNTGFILSGDRQIVETHRGTRPGGSLADVVFSILFSKVLQRRTRTTLQPHVPRVPWTGERSPWSHSATSADCSVDASDVVYADDLASFLTCEAPACLQRAIGGIAADTIDTLLPHGLNANVGPTKTAALAVPAGRGSRSVRRQLFSEGAGRLVVLPENRGGLKLDLVTVYKHLGSMVTHDGSLLPELKHRLAASRSAMKEGKQRLFACRAIPLARRAAVFRSHVLSALVPGLGTLPTFNGREWQTFSGGVLSLYRQLLCLRNDGGFRCTEAQILSRVGLPAPETLLQSERLRFLSQLVRHGPDAAWALLGQYRGFQDALRSAALWLLGAVGTTCSLGDIESDWGSWASCMLATPGRWKALLRRAEAWYAMKTEQLAALDGFARASWEAVEDTPASPLASCEHACFPCKLAFPTRQSWGAHAHRVHGYHSRAHLVAKGRTCQACGLVVATEGKLRTHLRLSLACVQRIETLSAAGPLAVETSSTHALAPAVPGIGKAALGAAEPEVLPSLMGALAAFSPPAADVDTALYELVQMHVAPLPVLRRTIERWRDSLSPGLLAQACDDVLLVLHPEHVCDRVSGAAPGTECLGGSFEPRVIPPPWARPCPVLPFLVIGDLESLSQWKSTQLAGACRFVRARIPVDFAALETETGDHHFDSEEEPAVKNVQKSKEAKMKAAMAGGKSRKKKWAKGKVKEKLANLVMFDKATYDKMLKEIPKAKLITPSVVSERLKVNGSVARVAIRHLEEKNMIMHVGEKSSKQMIYTRKIGGGEVQKSKEAKMKAAMAGGKSRKKMLGSWKGSRSLLPIM